MAKPYRLILFDCFNTLFLPEASRVPTVVIDGRATPSTAGLLRSLIGGRYPELEEETLHRAMRAAWRWSEQSRGEEHREIPALERFGRLFEHLGVEPPEEATLREMLATHMRGVTGAYVLPGEHRALLESLRGERRMAIFSNFDYAPALRDMLAREGIEAWFDPVVISAAIGYRKPGREAFRRAVDQTGEAPEDILLVGDSLGDDVAGAVAAAIDVAWLNRDGEPAPESPSPTYTIGALEEVESLLRNP